MKPEHLRFKLNFDDAYYLQYTDSQLEHTLDVLEDVGVDKEEAYVLHQNSANCQFFLFKSPKTNKTYFTKVQLDARQDPLDIDVCILSTIHKYIQNADPSHAGVLVKHFPELVAGTPLVLEWKPVKPIQAEVNFKKYFEANPAKNYFSDEYVSNRLELTCPTMITNAINKHPISLFDMSVLIHGALMKKPATGKELGMLVNVLGYDLSTAPQQLSRGDYMRVFENAMDSIFFPELYKLFYSLLALSEISSFMHNDLHAGNILWDCTKRCFVVIDFGRSFIKILSSDDLKSTICEVMPDSHVLDKAHPSMASMGMNQMFKLVNDMKKLTCNGASVLSNWMLFFNLLRMSPTRIYPFEGMGYNKKDATLSVPAINDVAAVSMTMYENLSSIGFYKNKFNLYMLPYFSFDGDWFIVPKDLSTILQALESPPTDILYDGMLSCLFPGLMWFAIVLLTYGKYIPHHFAIKDAYAYIHVKGVQSNKHSSAERLFYTTWVLLKEKFQYIRPDLIPISHSFVEKLMAYHRILMASKSKSTSKTNSNNSVNGPNNAPTSKPKHAMNINNSKPSQVAGASDSLQELTQAYERIYEVADELRAPGREPPSEINSEFFPSNTRSVNTNTRVPLPLPLPVTAYGGGGKGGKGGKGNNRTHVHYKGRQRKVRFDANKKKYIMMGGSQVYLKDIRGKYCYAT